MKPEQPIFEIASPATTSVGPARVIEVQGARVQLEANGQLIWAVSALAHCYQPAVGDTVLALQESNACYVIGVIHGSGAFKLTALGDLELRAPRGRIGIAAKDGVDLRGTAVTLTADHLEFKANTLTERFQTVSRWIKEALQLRAGRVRMTVTGDYRVKADRIIERADGDVKIDGNKIHLG